MGITPQQFQQLQQRTTRRAAAPFLESLAPVRKHQIVLGIDPSLRGTGFGVIAVGKPGRALTCGTIHCPATWERSRCLARIAEAIADVVRQHSPTVCAIEGLFYAQNLQTALIMGEARGASLVAVAQAGLEIFEVAPRRMKQAIVGYGAAQKDAVAKMVQRMLNLAEAPEPDAADALALAIAYTQSTGVLARGSAKRL